MAISIATDRANAITSANSFLLLAANYLDALTAAANVQFSSGFNIDGILPAAYNYASVPTVDFATTLGGLGTLPSITGANAPESLVFSFDAPATIALPADDLTVPTHAFEYAEGTYSRILLDPWQTKLLADLQNGGYGIDSTDETALFNRARDRETQAALLRVEEAGRAMAARGFPLPPGELSIHIDRAYQDMQDRVSGISREIFVNSATRFVENRRFTITEVREMERITTAFYNSVQERAVNVSRTTAELGIAVYNQLVARYKARLDASKLNGDIQYQSTQVKAEQAKALIENYRAQVMAYEMNLRREIEPLKIQTDQYRANIDNARVINDGAVSKATLQQKVIEATTQQNIQISNMTIENAKAKLLATVKGLEFQVHAAQFGAEKFFAQLTAMYGAINSLGVETTTS